MSMPAQVDNGKCTGCESCTQECPSNAITMDKGKAKINPDNCVDCGVCIDTCPAGAISL